MPTRKTPMKGEKVICWAYTDAKASAVNRLMFIILNTRGLLNDQPPPYLLFCAGKFPIEDDLSDVYMALGSSVSQLRSQERSSWNILADRSQI